MIVVECFGLLVDENIFDSDVSLEAFQSVNDLLGFQQDCVLILV
jgi:hypothetical protein